MLVTFGEKGKETAEVVRIVSDDEVCKLADERVAIALLALGIRNDEDSKKARLGWEWSYFWREMFFKALIAVFTLTAVGGAGFVGAAIYEKLKNEANQYEAR